MSFSVLSYLLVTERYRQKAASGGGFSVPVMSEREVPVGVSSIISTNARGSFVLTARNAEGVARFGFSPAPVDSEPQVLSKLVDNLWAISLERGWENRFSTVREALGAMKASPFPPKSLVLSQDLVSSLDPSQSGVTVGELEGVRVFASSLSAGTALLVTEPKALGVYTRVGDHLGLQLFNVRQTTSVIKTDGLAQ